MEHQSYTTLTENKAGGGGGLGRLSERNCLATAEDAGCCAGLLPLSGSAARQHRYTVWHTLRDDQIHVI